MSIVPAAFALIVVIENVAAYITAILNYLLLYIGFHDSISVELYLLIIRNN